MSDEQQPPRFVVEFGEGWHRIGPNAWVATPPLDAEPSAEHPEPLGPGWKDVGYVVEDGFFPGVELEADAPVWSTEQPTTVTFSTEGMSREHLELIYGGPLDGPRPAPRQKLTLGDREIGDVTDFEKLDDGSIRVHASVPARIARELGLLPELPDISVLAPAPRPSWHTPPQRDLMHMDINVPVSIPNGFVGPPPEPGPRNRAARRAAARAGRRKGR